MGIRREIAQGNLQNAGCLRGAKTCAHARKKGNEVSTFAPGKPKSGRGGRDFRRIHEQGKGSAGKAVISATSRNRNRNGRKGGGMQEGPLRNQRESTCDGRGGQPARATFQPGGPRLNHTVGRATQAACIKVPAGCWLNDKVRGQCYPPRCDM